MLTSFCQDIYQMLCKKYPNRKIYVIGDQHFYHKNIVNYTRSEFSDSSSMNQFIINCHNETVGHDDIVIFLGDFSFKKSLIGDLLSQMNGHKYLILGNHDSDALVKNYPSLGFEGVFTTPVRIKDDYLSHEPLIKGQKEDMHFNLVASEFQKQSKGINYHGHIHTDEVFPANFVNATCEAVDYKPILIGETKALTENQDNLFINSPYVDKALEELQKEFCFDPRLLLEDYIYSMLLESSRENLNEYFVQGSFGLFKKYGFLSKFSDLDISYFYNTSLSKGKNIENLKRLVDSYYKSLQNIDGINLSFYKRYSSLRIFEALYTSENPYFAKCDLDANLIFLDCYKPTDFVSLNGKSMIQNLLEKNDSSFVNEYHFPEFKSQFLVPEGDIANLILQILFQQGYKEKKAIALRKLNYVYNYNFKDKEMIDFLNLFIRFYLRNISLLHTLHRYDEIEHIQNQKDIFSGMLKTMPKDLIDQIEGILHNPNSEFLDIHQEISSTPVEDVLKKSSELVRRLK